jgi:CRP/FNR family transcriptional regulator
MIKKNSTNIITLSSLKVACHDCTLFQLCLPVGLNQSDLAQLDRIIRRRRSVKRGEFLYRSGDRFESIYAVKSGSFKTSSVTEEGQEQVTGLHLPGELFGMDAISSGAYCCAAVALEQSSVCEIPFNRFEELGAQLPGLMRQTVRIMSKEILRDKRTMQIAKNSASGRLAAFLLGLSERYHERGFAAAEFQLSMSRGDIGNYLGLADETVSRLFTRLQEEGLIEVERKRVRLLDVPRLQAIAKGLAGHMPLKAVNDSANGQADFLVWDPHFLIGIDAIDQQHQQLFDIGNRFHAAWQQHARRAVTRRLFDELLEYAGQHFAEEERLMQEIGYPDLAAHSQHHKELMALVDQYRAQLQAGATGAEKRALEFVKTWLQSHVLDADREIGVYLTAKHR